MVLSQTVQWLNNAQFDCPTIGQCCIQRFNNGQYYFVFFVENHKDLCAFHRTIWFWKLRYWTVSKLFGPSLPMASTSAYTHGPTHGHTHGLYPWPLPMPIHWPLPLPSNGLYPCLYLGLCLYQAISSTHGPIPCPMPPPPPTAYTHGLYPWHIPRLIPMALPMASTHRSCPWPLIMASTMQAWAGMTFVHLGTGTGIRVTVPNLREREREWKIAFPLRVGEKRVEECREIVGNMISRSWLVDKLCYVSF